MAVKVAVIYYSSTGNVYKLAQAVEEGAKEAGAEVRLRKVRELAPEEAIKSNQGWYDHVQQTQDVAEATLDDLEWAEAYIFGTPTRYGNVAAQLKQFIDTAGGLWFQGKLADKAASGFTSASTPPLPRASSSPRAHRAPAAAAYSPFCSGMPAIPA